MILIVICIVLIIISGLLWSTSKFFGVILSSLGLFGLLLIALMLPINHYIVKGEIKQFESIQKTVKESREKEINIEDAAIKIEIIKQNAWLADTQYWNTTVFDIFIPDKINKLEPLR